MLLDIQVKYTLSAFSAESVFAFIAIKKILSATTSFEYLSIYKQQFAA